MKKVLILGNGLSRQKFESIEFINNWDGEIWGCNNVFRERIKLPRLDLIIGDDQTVIDGYHYKLDNKLDYEIYAKRHITNYTNHRIQIVHLPQEYIKDSGTTLIYKALFENYDEIKVCGFDCGGKDIYVKGHEKKDKTIWIKRWREIDKVFTLRKIEFICNPEIKEFIMSKRDPRDHLNTYFPGKINNKVKERNFGAKTVLILGNGASRIKYKDFINNWTSEIWGCNWLFKEADSHENLTRIGSVHNEVISEAYKFKKENNYNYLLYTKPVFREEFKDKFISYFSDPRGWATGPLMVLQALTENYRRIYLSGFDFGGKDVYQNHFIEGSNFQKQFVEIISRFGHRKLKFVGKTPKFILQLQRK